MKNNYAKFLLMVLVACGFKISAQCSSCTTTITGTDAANHIIGSGTTFCIAPGGTATGLITITSGGTLCNSGTINSSNLWIAGGTLNNYGTINTSKILASGQGVYNNYGTVVVDSLLITNVYSELNNYGNISGTRLGNADNADIINNGTITFDYMADSTASFTNNSGGSFTVNYDYANAYNSGFFNYGYAKITRDFYNSTGSTFETSCMIAVGRDWYNSAIISGPASGCGGFNIAGGSYNSGTIGSASTHVDLCDAGHPTFGIDGPAGTIAGTTTYCSCTNSCIQLSGITEAVAESEISIGNLYPNPATTAISVVISDERTEALMIEVYDMMGRKQSETTMKAAPGQNKATIDLSALAQGTYILKVTDEQQQQLKRMFNVVK